MTVTDQELIEAAQGCTDSYWVHPRDLLFQYILRVSGRGLGMRGYFSGGRSDAQQAHRAMLRTKNGKNLKVLEFAAGYGRVARHSRDIFAGHSYTASDIHPEACGFLTDRLLVNSFLSAANPDHLNNSARFDFIFCLSLFSHLPHHSFGSWLSKLYSFLDTGGSLLFTTHGEYALAKHPKPFREMLDSSTGHGYGQNSDQPDLNPQEYGTMVVTMPYVINQLYATCPDARVTSFSSGVWFGLQDEWVIKKT